MECYTKMRDAIIEYIPAPPQKPGGYLVVRTRQQVTVPRDQAITIAWCHGRLLRAHALLREKPSKRIVRMSVDPY